MADDRDQAQKLQQQIEQLLSRGTECTPEELRRAAQLLEVLAQSQEEYGGMAGAPFPYGKYAVSYIQTHFQQRIRIGELADKIGVSRGYLTKVFKEEMGVSPQEYLITTRLEYAKLCLQQSNRRVRDIAIASGYEDSLAFSKAFKGRYAVSPSEYRKRIRGN